MVMTREDFMTQYDKSDVQKGAEELAKIIDKKLKAVADEEYSVHKACFKDYRDKGIVVLYETDYDGERSHFGTILDNFAHDNKDAKRQIRLEVIHMYQSAGWNVTWQLFKHFDEPTGVFRIKL